MSDQPRQRVHDLIDPERLKAIEYAYGRGLGYARSVLGLSLPDAEDAVNQAALVALKQIENYRERPGVPFTAWFLRILTNFVFSEHRARRRRERHADKAAEAMSSPYEPTIDLQLANARAARRRDDFLAELPTTIRVFFENWCLQRDGELDRDEAAALLGYTLEQYEAAKKRCRREIKSAATRLGLNPEELYSVLPRAAGSARGGHGDEGV